MDDFETWMLTICSIQMPFPDLARGRLRPRKFQGFGHLAGSLEKIRLWPHIGSFSLGKFAGHVFHRVQVGNGDDDDGRRGARQPRDSGRQIELERPGLTGLAQGDKRRRERAEDRDEEIEGGRRGARGNFSCDLVERQCHGKKRGARHHDGDAPDGAHQRADREQGRTHR